MAEIDIGSEAVSGDNGLGFDYVLIEEANPANLDGKITSVELWCNENLEGCKVAALYKTNGDTFTSRDVATIGDVAAGSKQTIPVSISVKAGDYIGLAYTAGAVWRSNGGVGYWYVVGVLPCTDLELLHLANFALSIYGTGEELALGHPRGFIIG